VQELSSRAAAGDHGDVVAAHAEQFRDESLKRLVGTPFDRRSRETHAETTVGDAGKLVTTRPGGDPDGQAQATAGLGQRPGVTT
jgi:hypothetical protein